MKALSIRQPWAWAILNAGKDIENREWDRVPGYRGPLLVHASKVCRYADYYDSNLWMMARSLVTVSVSRSKSLGIPYLPRNDKMKRGAIIGVVDIVDITTTRPSSPWTMDAKCWLHLANPRAFREPIPYKGRLGLFDVPDHLVAEALEVST